MKFIKIFIVFFTVSFLPLSCKKANRQTVSLEREPSSVSHRGPANTLANPFFYPNFSGNPYTLPQGTAIQPVCFNPNSPLCFNQWMSQAIPLQVSQAGQAGQFNYFVPSFIPKSGSLINPERDSDWERVRLPRLSRRDRHSETRVFYSNKKDPEKIIQVETHPETGKKTTTSGSVAYVNTEDIAETSPSGQSESARESGQSQSAGKSRESDQPQSTRKSNKADQSQSARESGPSSKTGSDPPVQVEGDQSPSAGAVPVSDPEIIPGDQPTTRTEDSPTTQFAPMLRPQNLSQETDTPSERDVSLQEESGDSHSDTGSRQYETNKATPALPAQAVKEIKEGCFVIDKQIDAGTEAHFCEECIKDTDKNKNFIALMETGDFLTKLKDHLSTVMSDSRKKVIAQIAGETLSNDGKTEICSPNTHLKYIIQNFEDTCQYKGGFKQFFKDKLCESCKKGIPMELMTAMMSIESGGRCTAINNDGEKSAGLFQIDGKQHQCTPDHTKGSTKNTTCLKKINNNWSNSIDILSSIFKQTNGKKPDRPCSDWLSMTPKQRDTFRRAVSGYNGGAGWVTQSLYYGRENPSSYTTNKRGDRKTDKASWEELRAFYFITQFKYKRGRKLDNTLKNLAHTEAVLGREVKNSPPGMIEIWSQYKSNFLKNNPKFQCPTK